MYDRHCSFVTGDVAWDHWGKFGSALNRMNPLEVIELEVQRLRY